MEYIDFKKLIDNLISKPIETEWIEFKHNFHSKEEIGERISAISNSALLCDIPHGYLVFGIDDKSHSIIGTDLYGKRKKVGQEELESWLSTRLNPRIDFNIIDDFDYEDKGHVCVFKIPATNTRPVTFSNQSYIRIGSTTRRLKDFPDKEAKIWNAYQTLESINVKQGLDLSDVLKLLSAETYFDMMQLPMPQDSQGIITRFISEHIVSKDTTGYSITKLGAILLAKDLSLFDGLNRKIVRVIVYGGNNKINTIREESFNAGYAVSFKTMISWINSQLPTNEQIGQALRKDARMYPEIAIRELVANMIIHQDFSQQGFPMVEIYSNRIEISNPGKPIISADRFIDEYQSRNDSLADIMRRMGICEEKGSGMDKAVFNIELYQLPPLKISIQENRTSIIVFSYKKFAALDKLERVDACYQHACLKYVSIDKMTNKSLRERLGIDRKNYSMASRIIKETLNLGKIKEANPDNGSKRMAGYIPFWA